MSKTNDWRCDDETSLQKCDGLSVTSKPFVGDVLVEDGKISKVGNIKPTRSHEVIDLTGKFLLPGFIDAHAHIGLYPEGLGPTESEGNEMTDPVTAHLQAIDAFYPEDESIKKALGWCHVGFCRDG